ncbi:hypothetical protein HanRHA438_Chr08g0343581 [Helianthus annuus]|nr:hypothetical protein HanRHA438_Chr08g0343581 [Helianthus annuus]
MSLKLLVDRKGSRVLFAEVPKEFVDFLFHIFSLPLGTLIELLGSKQMVGCLGKLKDSITSFNGNYLLPGIKMDDIFNPKQLSMVKHFCYPMMLLLGISPVHPKQFTGVPRQQDSAITVVTHTILPVKCNTVCEFYMSRLQWFHER